MGIASTLHLESLVQHLELLKRVAEAKTPQQAALTEQEAVWLEKVKLIFPIFDHDYRYFKPTAIGKMVYNAVYK